MVRIKRIYAPPALGDGYRVLVDRLWPRGLSKDAAAVDLWLKEIAPSHELRKWFHRDPARWSEFKARYKKELEAPERATAIEQLRQAVRDRDTVTLLFASREELRNHAALLRDLLSAGP